MENKKNMKKKNNLKDEKMKNMKKGSNNIKKNNNTNSTLKKENKNKESLKEETKVNVQEQLNLNENETKDIVNEKKVNVKESKQCKKELSETRKEKQKLSKEKKIKIVNTILVIVGIAALFGLVFFASTQRDNKEVISYVENITASKYFELKNGDENAVILLASPSCSWCQKYKPVLTKLSSDYQLPIYYLNTSSLSSDDYNSVYLSSPSISSSGSGLIPTPTTLLVKGGEEVDYISGYVEYNTVLNFLNKNGVIN